MGALCCCGRSRTGRVARAAEKLVNLLGGATFDLFFSELLVHLPGPHTLQWVAEADALCYAQRAFADPCSAGPCGQDLLWALPGRAGYWGSGAQHSVGFPARGAMSRISPSPVQQLGRALLWCRTGCRDSVCAGLAARWVHAVSLLQLHLWWVPQSRVEAGVAGHD